MNKHTKVIKNKNILPSRNKYPLFKVDDVNHIHNIYINIDNNIVIYVSDIYIQ